MPVLTQPATAQWPRIPEPYFGGCIFSTMMPWRILDNAASRLTPHHGGRDEQSFRHHGSQDPHASVPGTSAPPESQLPEAQTLPFTTGMANKLSDGQVMKQLYSDPDRPIWPGLALQLQPLYGPLASGTIFRHGGHRRAGSGVAGPCSHSFARKRRLPCCYRLTVVDVTPLQPCLQPLGECTASQARRLRGDKRSQRAVIQQPRGTQPNKFQPSRLAEKDRPVFADGGRACIAWW